MGRVVLGGGEDEFCFGQVEFEEPGRQPNGDA